MKVEQHTIYRIYSAENGQTLAHASSLPEVDEKIEAARNSKASMAHDLYRLWCGSLGVSAVDEVTITSLPREVATRAPRFASRGAR